MISLSDDGCMVANGERRWGAVQTLPCSLRGLKCSLLSVVMGFGVNSSRLT